jgi:hypothetical protein
MVPLAHLGRIGPPIGRCNMVENNTYSVGSFMLDRRNRWQTARGASRPIGVTFHVPPIRHRRGRQTPGAGRQVRQGGMRPEKRAPNYRLVAAWAALLIVVGAGAWCIGMAIHNNEALAQHHAPRPEATYYDDGYVDGLAGALGYSVEQMARAVRPRPPPNVAHR